jgi:hypothetical protein
VRKKIIVAVAAILVVVALALVIHFAGGEILATAKRHLSGLGL